MLGGYDQVQSAEFDIEAILNSYKNEMDSEQNQEGNKKKTFSQELKK